MSDINMTLNSRIDTINRRLERMEGKLDSALTQCGTECTKKFATKSDVESVWNWAKWTFRFSIVMAIVYVKDHGVATIDKVAGFFK